MRTELGPNGPVLKMGLYRLVRADRGRMDLVWSTLVRPFDNAIENDNKMSLANVDMVDFIPSRFWARIG